MNPRLLIKPVAMLSTAAALLFSDSPSAKTDTTLGAIVSSCDGGSCCEMSGATCYPPNNPAVPGADWHDGSCHPEQE